MSKSITVMTTDELLVVQRAGVDASNFLRNDFYATTLRPRLEAMREQAKNDGDWTPAKSTDTEVVALFNAYNSGKRAGLAGIEAACYECVRRGEDAGKELERRAKKSATQRPQ